LLLFANRVSITRAALEATRGVGRVTAAAVAAAAPTVAAAAVAAAAVAAAAAAVVAAAAAVVTSMVAAAATVTAADTAHGRAKDGARDKVARAAGGPVCVRRLHKHGGWRWVVSAGDRLRDGPLGHWLRHWHWLPHWH